MFKCGLLKCGYMWTNERNVQIPDFSGLGNYCEIYLYTIWDKNNFMFVNKLK